MSGKRSSWLPLWILGPLVLLVVVVSVALALPATECGGEETEEGVSAAVLVTVVAGSAAAAAGAGLFRLVAMILRRQYAAREGWILLAAAIVLAAAVFVSGAFGEGVAIGFLLLTGLALLALIAAAIARRRVEDVGVLVPIYLFGAAYVYLLVGGIALLVSSGVGC